MSLDVNSMIQEVEEFARSFGVKIREKQIVDDKKVILKIFGSKSKVREVIEYIVLKYRVPVRILQESEVSGKRESVVEVALQEG